MAGFLYFLPDEPTKPTGDRLRELELGHLDGAQLGVVESKSPDGATTGLLVADRSALGEHTLQVDDDAQEWAETPAGWWLGFIKAEKPTPEQLRGGDLLPGYWVSLADGNKWALPIVREVNDQGDPKCGVPARLVRDRVTRDLVPGPPAKPYQYLWDATEWAWQAMVAEQEVDEIEAEQTTAMLLGANYRVGPEELLALGAWSTNVRPEGLLALSIGYPAWADWKSQQAEAVVAGPGE
ncbi:hypothetical protein KOR34_45300 [Posidoniimonas corsicana]|uniref:Uncharacterized protein n=1 Tax=Posidoniimonas corsicana TaxID=1938618 RepID=A0A5C5UXS7_9BACT|nr:hypothetical protein [Posidoniimonas corsicana]TWT31154.1 hypothetical protein KOR34_45300 [Posidoniimonas corsicana]